MVRADFQPCHEAEIEEKNFYHNVFSHPIEEQDLEELETFFLASEDEDKIKKKEVSFRSTYYEPGYPRHH